MALEIQRRIDSALAELELAQGCRVLFACESGSRAWGFPSPDSDYDLRFVYAMPLTYYLTVLPGRDTLEAMLPDALDLAGWELRKTLKLFAECNVSLYEWLGSPIVYKNLGFAEELRALVPDYFNARKAMHHYLSSARGMAHEHLSGSDIRIKKFFYILRPLYAALWIERHASMPPTEFAKLYESIRPPAELVAEIDEIRERKKTAAEGERVPLSSALRDYLLREEARLHAAEDQCAAAPKRDWSALDRILRERVQS